MCNSMQLRLQQKYSMIGPEKLLFKINQSRATRKCRDLTCYAWCDKKLDGVHNAPTVANLLIVNVNAEAVCVV